MFISLLKTLFIHKSANRASPVGSLNKSLKPANEVQQDPTKTQNKNAPK